MQFVKIATVAELDEWSKPMSTDPSTPDPTRPPTNPTSRPTVPTVPPGSPPYAPSVGSVIGAAALFLFACVPYWLMMWEIFLNWRCCDPHNDGGLSRYFINRGREFGDLALAFFALDVILLWILLGFLLIPPVMRRSSSGHAAWWEVFGAFILFPLSLFSTVYALGLYERYHGWAIAVCRY